MEKKARLDLRDPEILDRLLGRTRRAVMSSDERQALRGERVLITGAGGSIGSELTRQIAACQPAALMLFDNSEYGLFRIEREIRATAPSVPLYPVLGDVSRARDVRDAFAQGQPSLVCHAAAYKHVSMLERDITAALRTNVLGTLHVARQARRLRARLVVISSDKAANPTSVMGASKRFAELAVLAECRRGDQVAVVRFGNVLGSSGSVLELMVEALRDGQPLTVTDPGATRYFMSPREAAALVLKADGVGRTGEILWLDMGAPVRIIDLAQQLISLAAAFGLAPVPVRYVGLRPGEKLTEELTAQGLEMLPTRVPEVWIARQERFSRAAIRSAVAQLPGIVRARRAHQALQLLCAAVPEYTPSELAQSTAAASGEAPRAFIAPRLEGRRARQYA